MAIDNSRGNISIDDATLYFPFGRNVSLFVLFWHWMATMVMVAIIDVEDVEMLTWAAKVSLFDSHFRSFGRVIMILQGWFILASFSFSFLYFLFQTFDRHFRYLWHLAISGIPQGKICLSCSGHLYVILTLWLTCLRKYIVGLHIMNSVGCLSPGLHFVDIKFVGIKTKTFNSRLPSKHLSLFLDF